MGAHKAAASAAAKDKSVNTAPVEKKLAGAFLNGSETVGSGFLNGDTNPALRRSVFLGG